MGACIRFPLKWVWEIRLTFHCLHLCWLGVSLPIFPFFIDKYSGNLANLSRNQGISTLLVSVRRANFAPVNTAKLPLLSQGLKLKIDHLNIRY